MFATDGYKQFFDRPVGKSLKKTFKAAYEIVFDRNLKAVKCKSGIFMIKADPDRGMILNTLSEAVLINSNFAEASCSGSGDVKRR